MFKRIIRQIIDYWHVATEDTPIFHYVILDIEVSERSNALNSIIYYRPIGSRGILSESVEKLNKLDILMKFPPNQIQIVSTLATAEYFVNLTNNEKDRIKYKEYIKKCLKLIKKD